MTREQLLGQIMYLRKRVAMLEERNTDIDLSSDREIDK